MKKFYIILSALGVSVLFLIWAISNLNQGSQKVEYSPAIKTCEEESPIKYCVYRAEQGTNGNIAYYLHGRNLDEHTWNDDTFYTSMIQRHWLEKNIKPPLVVAISFGNIWLLTPKGRSQESGLLEKFTDSIKKIEKKIGSPRERLLFGESMGGLNSIVAGLSSDGFFAKVAALCPGVYKDSPFASLSELKTSVQRTGADPKIVFWGNPVSKTFYFGRNGVGEFFSTVFSGPIEESFSQAVSLLRTL